MLKRSPTVAELADSLLYDLRCAVRFHEPADVLRDVSGAGARAWLFALADRTAVKAWLAAQPDPIDFAVCLSPGQDLLARYLVSLVPQTQKDPPSSVPVWDDIAWVAPFLGRVDDIAEHACASERHPVAPDEISALVDQAAETARLWRIFVPPDARPGDVVYRTLFHHVAGTIVTCPHEVAAELRAYRDQAQALLEQIAPVVADGLLDVAAAREDST